MRIWITNGCLILFKVPDAIYFVLVRRAEPELTISLDTGQEPLNILLIVFILDTEVFSQNIRSKLWILVNLKKSDYKMINVSVWLRHDASPMMADMWAWVAGAESSDMESSARIWEGEIIHCGLISVKKPLIGLIGGNLSSRGNMDLWGAYQQKWWRIALIL